MAKSSQDPNMSPEQAVTAYQQSVGQAMAAYREVQPHIETMEKALRGGMAVRG